MTDGRNLDLRAAPGPQPSPGTRDVDVEAQIAALQQMDIHDLRIRWRREFRKKAPEHLPRYLLLRMVAHRIQVRAFGDLDRETARYLDQVAKELRKRRNAAERDPRKQKSSAVPGVVDKRPLRPGTLLAREHDGVLHRVMVVREGYSWNGETYRSLSEIARAITGTNWNGPRFFGLRQGKAAPAPEGASA